MKLLKWFKRPPKDFWFSLGPPLPAVPPCPLHGDTCGYVRVKAVNLAGARWAPTYEACPAWESAVAHSEWGQRHEYFWDPQTGNLEPHPR